MGRTTGIECKAGVLVNFFVVVFFLFVPVLAVNNVGGVGGGGGGDRNQIALKELHEENWREMLKGEWMVEFFAPWCPACKSLAPTWERFAQNIAPYGVSVAKIDVTTSPSLSGRFFVTALPTIYHVKDGEFRQYRGSRDGDALIQYIKLKQWQKTEKISAWKKPDTIHMSILSFFFKLSHTLKDFNTRLQEEYGLPSWGSYALFAVGTVFVGATLGLILVCVVDFLHPPKRTPRQSFAESKERVLKEGVEDLAQYDLEDDADEDGADAKDDKSESSEENDEAEGEGDADGDGDEDKDAEDEDETSQGELCSQSETDSEKSAALSGNDKEKNAKEEKEKEEAVHAKASAESAENDPINATSDVRKRKPRKAD